MLGSSRGDLTQRRTDVAVLFADLSGFTGLVESVEPEVVYGIVRPMMDEFVALVHAHDGEIQQVLGDGFMSVFGLRRQHADDANQAVRAAIALVEAGRRQPGRLPVHVGIECGQVLVSPSWEPASFGVWGRAVTIAKRLCDLAEPGTILVGPQAFELVGSEVGFARRGQARLKGTRSDVLVRRVTRCSTRPMAMVG
jgi:class 3 adenylate cyclase